jgi:CO/xanthine dehydrogenase Mo-binding subunit
MSFAEPTLTRRDFIRIGGGVLVVTIALPDAFTPSGARAEASSLDATKLASWLEIRADGTIVARTGKAEMGVGMSAYYPQMVAEELRVRPETITLIMGDTDRTPDGGWSADFLNGAENLRKVAAYAYQALIGLAAERLGVPAASLTVVDGVVRTGGGARSVSYAELVKGRELDLKIPITSNVKSPVGIRVTGNPPMKPVSEYTVVGTSFPAKHVEEKVTARTEWVADLRLPGMLHARMVRPAALGSTLVSAGALDKQRFPTADLLVKKNLVAVVSPDEWEAVTAARAVAQKTQWTAWGGLPGHSKLSEAIRKAAKPGGTRGDAAKVVAAMAAAAKTVSVTYEQPYVKHAPIGPFIAVADAKADGTIMVYTHSALSQGLRGHLADMAGVPFEHVTVRWLEGAGQYGRTSLGGDGAEADAVLLSKELGKPVRVVWTLQEDLEWSSNSPGWVADLKAGLDAHGKLLAIQSDFYSPHQNDTRMVGALLAGAPEITVSSSAWPPSFGFGRVLNPYTIEELHAAYGMGNLGEEEPASIGLRGNIMRTPMHRQHVFALESLLNEAAIAAGVDAVQFRLNHTTDKRLIDILKKTAEAAGWQSRPSPNPAARRTGTTPVKGRGVGVVYRFGAYWAGVAEVEVTPSTGVVKVTRFTMGVDPGKIINPRHLKLICEGGVVMGLSEALKEEVAFNESKILSNTWARYPIMTMAETPDIQIVTISRDDEGFGGGGEAANTVAPAALVAAVFDATGVQPRRTPLTPAYMQRILKA